MEAAAGPPSPLWGAPHEGEGRHVGEGRHPIPNHFAFIHLKLMVKMVVSPGQQEIFPKCRDGLQEVTHFPAGHRPALCREPLSGGPSGEQNAVSSPSREPEEAGDPGVLS